MLTVICPPDCLSHQQNLCRLSFTLLNNPPSVSVSHPAAAALSFTSASDSQRAHPARDTSAIVRMDQLKPVISAPNTFS